MIDPERTQAERKSDQQAGGGQWDNAETFADLGVCPELCEAVKKLKWQNPSAIQKAIIPHVLDGKDAIGLAETGSGKTGAFALPVIQRLLDEPQRFYCLVLAPTRELAVQIAQHFEALGAAIALSTCILVGGMDMASQQMELAKKPHVIVATPGRVMDHLENTKGFHLKTIKFLIMDEADRLLSMDFDDSLNRMLPALPRHRQTLLFSATMTSKVSKLQRASLVKPVKCEVSSKYDTAAGLTQNYLFIPMKYKYTWLAATMSMFKAYSAMIFVDTCIMGQRLAIFLRHMGFSTISLHGQMSQAQRLGALNKFKAAAAKVMVATDVASRGLDIPAVDVVLNFDLPKNSKDYIHRVGRTARAGRNGRAITLVTQYDVEGFQRIEHMLGKKLDELKDVTEEKAMTFNEKCIECLRTADYELKEASSTGKEKKKRGPGAAKGAKKKKRKVA